MELFTKRIKKNKEPEEIKILLVKPEDYKILLVEDGSIDVDDLEQFIDEHNLKIKIVAYRAGSVPPCFLKQTEVNE